MYDSTISRNEGWNFGNQVLERADKTSRVLDANTIICLSPKQVGSSLDLIQWAALLSVSAYDMYRKKYGKLSSVLIL
jgi:uncharacterized alpha-E superfamily protein